MVQWVKTFLGHRIHWILFPHPSDPTRFIVALPKMPEWDEGQPISSLNLNCYKLTHTDAQGKHEFVVAMDFPPPKGAKGADRKLGSDEWYKNIIQTVLADTRGQLDPEVPEK